jgi:hypothetical protein
VDFLGIKYLRKNEKDQRKFFEGHDKDQIEKNYFFIFLPYNNQMASANVFGLTFKTKKTRKTAQSLNICKIFVNSIFGNVELKFCSPNITRGIYKCPKYKSGWSFGYW